MSNKSGNSNAKEEVEKVEKSVVMSNQFSSVLSTLSSFRTQITMLQNQIRGLEKTVSREMKRQQKEVAKGKNKGNRVCTSTKCKLRAKNLFQEK